jgi:4-hydroxy-tetrahydrodipicolinate synthase
LALKISGVLIAPATPLTENGEIHFDRLSELVEYLLATGIDGICVGGGTAEYPRFDIPEREELIRQTVRFIDGRARVVASVGMASFDRVLQLGRFAADRGVEALLLPPPHFFVYSQGDLEHFYRQANRRLPLPCLLYNLPFFTTPLESETASRLLATEEGIVGIKDSSGDHTALERFRRLEADREVSLIMGNDELLLEALRSGWDGVISGLGNLCPELLVLLHHSFHGGDFELAEYCQRRISELIEWVVTLPVPWAIRSGLEFRGIPCGPYSVPPSPARVVALREFQNWFEQWLDETLARVMEVRTGDVRGCGRPGDSRL